VTHPHSLLGYCPVMNACARKLAARREAVGEAGAEVDIWRELGRMTLAVVGTAAFGWAAGAVLLAGWTGAVLHAFLPRSTLQLRRNYCAL
jgi:hypothetical protein